MLMQAYTDGICEALFDEFGAGCEIYTEPLEQGLIEPCFSVLPDKVSFSPACGGQKLFRIDYSVRFYSANEDGFSDCGAVYERMYDALGLISVGTSLARTLDFSGEVNDDGVLVVTFAFERLYRQAETQVAPMATLSTTISPA